MLTADGCRRRRERLWERVPGDVEWLLVADPRHVHYLSNFWIGPNSWSTGERGLLLLEREQGTTLLADNLSIRSAGGPIHVDHQVEQTWYDHRHAVKNRDHVLFAALEQVAERIRGRLGLLEAEYAPVGICEILDLEIVGGHDGQILEIALPEGEELDAPEDDGDVGTELGTMLRELRRSKLPDEIDLIRASIRAGEAAHARAREIVRPGVSEFEIYRAVHAAALEAAGRPCTIYGDFRAVSPQQPKLGGPPTSHVLDRGELFILDFSVVLDGYRGDFTNTIAVGPPSAEVRKMHALCLAAMESGARSLRAGATGAEIHAAVMAPLAAAGYGEFFPHHAGHGVGLAHPEPPILVPQSDDVLQAGDVVTLEPGLYIPGVGGMRIEHNYLVTASGCEQLTQHVIALE